MPPKKKVEDKTATEEVSEVKDNAQPASASDETDVQSAKDMDTSDGKGDDSVPPSDFHSFATEGVNKSNDDLASEVLAGLWGDYNVNRDRLDNAGHDSSSILARVNDRLSRGAPAAYRPDREQLLDQVNRGEWSSNPRVLQPQLLGAGFNSVTVAEVVRSISKG